MAKGFSERFQDGEAFVPTKIVGFAGLGSGPRGPLAGLSVGAYYQDPVNVPIGIGSYEASLGADQATGTLPDQTLLGILQSLQPIGPVTPWAELDPGGDWKEVNTTNRLLYQATQAQLDIAQATSGDLPNTIGVYASDLLDGPQIQGAFDSSHYAWIKSEGVYAQSDTNRVPQITFLHWGQLRNPADMANRPANEDMLAKMLNGQLVYPVAVPATGADRGRPVGTFADAISAEFNGASPSLVMTEMSPRGEMIERAFSLGGALLIMSCAAGLGYIGWRHIRGYD